jgi:serine/threonine protein kinase
MPNQQLDVESVFMEALQIHSPEDRRAYLDQHCDDDAELRAQIEDLLRAHEDAGSFLESPPVGFAATIAAGGIETVDDYTREVSLGFLAVSDKANCLGTLGQYEVIDVVGRGGMGLVLRAYDTKLNRVVAIKVMAPALAANGMAVKRFLREARSAAAVSHDHVVTIHAIEETNDPPFIVMEFVEGQSLQEKVDQEGALVRLSQF